MSVLLPTWKGAWLHVLEHSSKVGECSRHCTPISTLTRSRRDRFSACPLTPLPRSQPSPPTLPWAARVLWVEAHGVLCLRGPAPSTELAGRSLPAWGGEERTPDHSGSSEPTEMKQLSALSAGGCLRIKKKINEDLLPGPEMKRAAPTTIYT